MLNIDDIVKNEIPSDLRWRIGKFKVSDSLFDSPISKDFVELMKNFLVIRAEHIFMDGYFEFTAVSHLFGKKEEGCIAPEYTFKISNDDGVMKIRTIKVGDTGKTLIRALRKIDI